MPILFIWMPAAFLVWLIATRLLDGRLTAGDLAAGATAFAPTAGILCVLMSLVLGFLLRGLSRDVQAEHAGGPDADALPLRSPRSSLAKDYALLERVPGNPDYVILHMPDASVRIRTDCLSAAGKSDRQISTLHAWILGNQSVTQ